MIIYIQSIDYIIWEIIEYGPYMLTKIIKINGKLDQFVPNHGEEYNEDDKRKLSLNAGAKNLPHCALDRNKFIYISTCKSTYDISHTLEVTHVGLAK